DKPGWRVPPSGRLQRHDERIVDEPDEDLFHCGDRHVRHAGEYSDGQTIRQRGEPVGNSLRIDIGTKDSLPLTAFDDAHHRFMPASVIAVVQRSKFGVQSRLTPELK